MFLHTRRSFLIEWAIFLLALAIGAALRFYRLGTLPPGLYQDEAYNGLDALEVIRGARPIYFPANNGREPFFIYLQSLSVAVLGRTPLALRLPSAIIGTLTIPAAYALGRALFGRRVGLLAAAITAGNWWSLALSRIGLRAGTLPLFTALTLACAVAGWRSRRLWLVALGGALYGLSFYTYLAVRFTPLVLLAFLIFWYIAQRRTFPAVRSLSAFVLPAALVVAPLAGYVLSHPEIVFGRAEQVSILSQDVNGGDLWGPFFHNLLAALGMFVWRGDLNARHNLPGRPVFDLLLGAAFVVGVLVCLWRVFQRPFDRAVEDLRQGAALALLWSGVMLAPTVLSKDAPHYLRAAGVLPMIYLFPALALEALWNANPLLRRWAVGRGVVVLVVVTSLGLTARDYFGPYVSDPNTGYFFQAAATELASQINGYLGAEDGSVGRRSLYLDQRLWEVFPSVRFLVPTSAALHVFGPGEKLTPTTETRLVVWPYEDPRAALKALPEGALIHAEAGPLYRGDKEPAPYSLFTTFTTSPAPASSGAPLAEFERGIILLSAHVISTATGLQVDLIWQAQPNQWRADGTDYHIFTKLLNGTDLIAENDGPPANALYPTYWWRGGDVVLDSRSLPLPAGAAHPGLRLLVGLYAYPSVERLRLKNDSGDSVELLVR